MAIPLKYTAIFWDDKGSVEVADIRNAHDLVQCKKFRYSGGACWAKWVKARPETVITYFSELQLELLFKYNVCVETLEKIHARIEEYRDGPITRASYLTDIFKD